MYEGCLQSSWTQLITPSRNFVEVRWRSLFRSTSLGKWCTSYNTPLTSRKRAADCWSLRNFLPRSSLFTARKAQKSHEARYELNSVFGLEKVDQWNPIRTSAIQSTSRKLTKILYEFIASPSEVCVCPVHRRALDLTNLKTHLPVDTYMYKLCNAACFPTQLHVF
jgi:hypothetical protein